MDASKAGWRASHPPQVGDVGDQADLAAVPRKGAYGTVRLARTQSDETVAVKMWDLRRGKTNQATLATRLLPDEVLAERRAWNRVGVHPNVVEIRSFFIDVSLAGFRAGFVLEPCIGSLCQAWINEQHLNEYTYARYFKEMAQALAYIHSAGVVHRDVKQDNFILGGSEGRTVKLCNFEHSAVLIGGRGLFGQTVGTLPYMAPEMISIYTSHKTPVDVWSLGVIVYTAFFGCWPYQPEENAEEHIRRMILHGAVLPSFTPAKCCPQNVVSEDGILFVKALLDRNPVTRTSAAACLEMEYLKDWQYKQLMATAMGAESISLAPMLNAALTCRALNLKLPKVQRVVPV